MAFVSERQEPAEQTQVPWHLGAVWLHYNRSDALASASLLVNVIKEVVGDPSNTPTGCLENDRSWVGGIVRLVGEIQQLPGRELRDKRPDSVGVVFIDVAHARDQERANLPAFLVGHRLRHNLDRVVRRPSP